MIEISSAHTFRPASRAVGSLQDTFRTVVTDVKDVLDKGLTTTQPSPAPIKSPAPQPTNQIFGIPAGTLLLAGGLAAGAGLLIFLFSRD